MVGLAVVLALVLVGGLVVGVRWWVDRDRSELERAMGVAPADGERFSFTDWRAVRTALDAGLDAGSESGEVEEFLNEAFAADLAATSALVASAATLQVQYGFSPATLGWELFAQGAAGAVVVMDLGEDADLDTVAERLTRLGYEEPDEQDGVWTGGDELLARIGGVTPELAHVALDRDRGLVAASDNAEYLRGLVADDGLTGLEGDDADDVAAAVEATGDPLAAAVYTGGHVCGALSMGQADAGDHAAGEQLVDKAGGVHVLQSFVMAALPDGDIRVAMALETGDQAREDADSRAELASGPAPGQGGDFADRFELGPVSAEGRVVTMDLDPVEGSYVLSDLSTGPVLFATC